jgi:hypothetical protein
MPDRRSSDLVPRLAFYFSLFVAVFALGYMVHRHAWWPHPIISNAEQAFRDLRDRSKGTREWYYFDTDATRRATLHHADAMAPGPTLIAYVGADEHQFIEVIDANANVLNQWRVDWFDLWPDADHLEERLRPKTLPGAIVHGVLLMKDGGVLLQHDACGLVRLDACGHVVWRLAQRTHHSLNLDDRGHIWTSIRHSRHERLPGLFTYHPIFEEYTIAEISPDGQLLQEVSLFDLLRENGLPGLLYLATWNDNTIDTSDDTMHVNDVEVFTSDFAPGFFQPGDVMVSVRRMNAVMVFDLTQRKLKHFSIGGFVRQHDPDFIDGNTLSIFDNHHIGSRSDGVQSRIVIEDVPAGTQRVAFSGTAERPFFTDIMGKHQWLPNGNLMLVESTRGRVLEVDPEGRLVWEFVNVLGNGLAGAVSEGTRLSANFTADFFAGRRSACGQPLEEAPGRVPSD